MVKVKSRAQTANAGDESHSVKKIPWRKAPCGFESHLGHYNFRDVAQSGFQSAPFGAARSKVRILLSR